MRLLAIVAACVAQTCAPEDLADRVAGALWGMVIADALTMPTHWFYGGARQAPPSRKVITLVGELGVHNFSHHPSENTFSLYVHRLRH